MQTGTEFLFGQSTYVQDPIARAKDALSWDKGGPDVENFGRHLDGAKHMLDRRGALTKYGWLLRDGDFPNISSNRHFSTAMMRSSSRPLTGRPNLCF